MPSSWVIRHAPRPSARARLYCFPHAGGGASAFRLWPRELPAELEVVAVQLPGRENRLRDPPIPSIPALVEALVPALVPELDRPFAFFGHSMGAVLAADVTRALAAQGAPRPGHLFVSGRRAPHLPPIELPFSGLPDEAFLAELQARYGGLPREILAERDLLALLVPTLRADIRALELHRPGPERRPLACPVTAFGGATDWLVPPEDLEGWRAWTQGAFRLRLFPGGHFYLDAQRAPLLADVGASMASLAAPRAGEARA
jgi:surfactin synthase thioesterase subunit